MDPCAGKCLFQMVWRLDGLRYGSRVDSTARRVLYAHLMSVLIIIIIVIVMQHRAPLQFSLVKQQIIIWTCRFMQIARGECVYVCI